MSDDIFPPITLDAGRDRWMPRDKLARLVETARMVGSSNDIRDVPEEWRNEERALFAEIASLLEQGDSAICEKEDSQTYLRALQEERDEARAAMREILVKQPRR